MAGSAGHTWQSTPPLHLEVASTPPAEGFSPHQVPPQHWRSSGSRRSPPQLGLACSSHQFPPHSSKSPHRPSSQHRAPLREGLCPHDGSQTLLSFIPSQSHEVRTAQLSTECHFLQKMLAPSASNQLSPHPYSWRGYLKVI